MDNLNEMIETLNAYGDFALGGEPEAAAQEWLDAGFTPLQADAWVEAGCWDAVRSAQLRDAGLTAEQVEGIDASAQGFSINGPGYDFANGEMSLADVLAAVNA